MTAAQREAAERVTLEAPRLLPNSEAVKLLQQQHDNLVNHQRLGHAHSNRLKLMAKLNTILGMPTSLRRTHLKLCSCSACLRAKIRRRNAPRVNRPLKLNKRRVHVSFDRSGRTQKSIDGFHYMVYAIDAVTKRVFAWPLQSKLEEEFLDVVINGEHGLVEILKFQMKAGDPAEIELELSSNHDEVLPPTRESEAYSPSVHFRPMPMDQSLHDITLNGEQSQPGHPQRKLRTDGENTFLTHSVRAALSAVGFVITTSRPYTPTENSLVERVQGTITRMTAASLEHSNMPMCMWTDHALMAVFAYNCTLHQAHINLLNDESAPRSLRRGMSPFELDLGITPEVQARATLAEVAAFAPNAPGARDADTEATVTYNLTP